MEMEMEMETDNDAPVGGPELPDFRRLASSKPPKRPAAAQEPIRSPDP
jgi:hypothetical protein